MIRHRPRRARERTSFLGRADELAALPEAFRRGRLVTLHGPPGVGKTRLALRFADGVERAGASHPAVTFVDLTEAQSTEDLAVAVAIALGVPLPPAIRSRGAAAEVGQPLGARGEALLVLDELEHLVAFAEPTVGAWLDAAPALRILVTSRE